MSTTIGTTVVSICTAVVAVSIITSMMGLFTKKQFDVKGKRVLITGGSTGMGRSVARMLADRGASVIIVARTESKLIEAVEYISQGAASDDTQTFSYISADLSSASECARIVSEAMSRWGGFPPDVVWACAGSAHPTFLVDTPPEVLAGQMSGNYLSAAWTAQAAIRAWVGRSPSFSASDSSTSPSSSFPLSTIPQSTPQAAATTTTKPPLPVRHLVFTSSLAALYTLAGYSAYSPTKAAMRSLSDTLSQELLLYSAAGIADIRTHTVFPATIYSASLEDENALKSDLTKMLEEDDDGQSPDACAAAAIAGLERAGAPEMLPTTLLGWLAWCAVLGGSKRAAGVWGWMEGLAGLVMVLAMPWIRWFYDRKVVQWARVHGASGAKTAAKKA